MAKRRTPTTPTPKTRVALYVRVSALMGRGGDDFHSPDVQLDGMRNLIAREQLREIAVIDDDIDESGQSMNRPGITRIRELVEAGHVDVVAVYTLSRVGRNLAESLAFIRWLREHGVAIISANERIDETPEGQFMLGMWLNMAELQGNQIGQNWAAIIERRARRGLTHGQVPAGYLRTAGGHLEPDPALAPIVADMFRAYADGVEVAAITALYAAARGRPVERQNVKRLLRNPIYVGVVIVESQIGGIVETRGAHEPLVDDDTWQRVQARHARDATAPPRHISPGYSLTGLLICAECGKHLQVWHSHEHGKDRPTRRIHCQRRKVARDCVGVGSPLYGPIEARILDELAVYARNLRVDRAAVARRARMDGAVQALPGVAAERAAVRQAEVKLATAWAMGRVSDDVYEATRAELAASLDALGRRETDLRALARMPPPSALVGSIDELFEVWPDASGGERNHLLRSVVRDVTIRKGRRWREPAEDLITSIRFRWYEDLDVP